MSTLAYKRVLIKLSGEAFGSHKLSVDPKRLRLVVAELRKLRQLGVAVAVVVGAGNLWRKRSQGRGLGAEVADYMGLLATVMNGLVLADALKKARLPVCLQSPLSTDFPGVSTLDAVTARGSLRRGQIVVFAGGTGKPFFTTDTAAAQRAVQIRAQLLIKAGPVDGVYTADPRNHKRAIKYEGLTLSQALRRKLGVMDQQAFTICWRYRLPILVCKWQSGVLARAVQGKKIGTLVTP
jgi:uridylate kinase